MACRVLVIDDNPNFRSVARQLLERHGFVVVAEAGTGTSGIAKAEEQCLDLVLLDVQLPDLDGFEVAERLARLDRPVGGVLTSGLGGPGLGGLGGRRSGVGLLAEG